MNAPAEEWRTVDGLRYQVSSLGRVKGHHGRILTPRVHPHGYMRVSLRGPELACDAYIHRLVCQAFHGAPPTADYQVDHKNKDRSDNRAANLRWVTRDENLRHRALPHGESHPHAKINSEIVAVIRMSPFQRGQDSKLAQEFGVSRETVRDIRLGKAWRHVQ